MKLRRLKTRRAFTLVEIMIVVGIVILLGALSIHGLLRVKVNANDGAALGSLKSIAAALETYRVANAGYTNDFDDLSKATPSYLSTAFDDAEHQGYNFYILEGDTSTYLIYAQPVRYGVTGSKFVFYDQSGANRFDDYAEAQNYIAGGVWMGPGPGPSLPAAPSGWVAK